MESLIEFNISTQASLPKIQTINIKKQPENQRRRSNSLPQLKTLFHNSLFHKSLYLDNPNKSYYSSNNYLHEYV